jgi:quercetin 2,3-dioxygenase
MKTSYTATAQIFLASERGHTETDGFRSYHTFPFGHYQPAGKEPPGSLYRLSDETLGGSQTISVTTEEDTLILLLPMVGGIISRDKEGNDSFVEAGQVQLYYQRAGEQIQISNPYSDELVNYLQLGFRCKGIRARHSVSFSFNINEGRNQLTELFTIMQGEQLIGKASIGKFDGRKETEHHLLSQNNRVMAFVLQGAFEIENRLLESRDSLALWNTTAVELEALSNEAILLFLEIS